MTSAFAERVAQLETDVGLCRLIARRPRRKSGHPVCNRLAYDRQYPSAINPLLDDYTIIV